MAAPKARNAVERERVRAEIAALDRRGYSQNEIAARVGIAQPTVKYHLRKIVQRYRESQVGDTAASVYCKLLQYRELRKEAWEAWERSKEDGVRTVTERTAPLVIGKPVPSRSRKAKEAEKAPGDLSGLKTTRVATVVEGRLPATEYLRTICDCLKAERELLGLDAPKKSQVAMHTLDWASLLQVSEETDGVEDRIERALERTKAIELKGLSVAEVVETLDDDRYDKEFLNGNGHQADGEDEREAGAI